MSLRAFCRSDMFQVGFAAGIGGGLVIAFVAFVFYSSWS
jgi:hypothetical protein